MQKCQYCGKELSETEFLSNYCFDCGSSAGAKSSNPVAGPERRPPQGEPKIKERPDKSVRCPRCNFLNPKNAKFCCECSAPLTEDPAAVQKSPQLPKVPEEKKCPGCGKEVKDHWKVCAWCGTSLPIAEPVQEPVPKADKCPKCNKDVIAAWASCPFCGNPLSKMSGVGNVITKVIFPDQSEKEITGDELIIGREDFEECQRKGIITRDQLQYISRRKTPQFKIVRKNNSFYLIDNNSSNWTLVNTTKIGKKEQVQELLLNDGDVILPGGETIEEGGPKLTINIINKQEE